MSEPKIKDAINNNNAAQSIGGQAVIEGVMMRGKTLYAIAVRKTNKEIEVVKTDIAPSNKRLGFLKLPIFRGMAAFVDSLVMGMKIITVSAEIAIDEVPEENETPSKFEMFLTKHFGDKLNDIILYISVFVSIALSIVLFMLTPTFLASFVRQFTGGNTWILAIFEGLLRIFILVGYIYLISRMKDIQRVFGYHGAEHKTINCFESGEELTVANVAKNSRLHKRCGTSFLLIVMIVSMVVFFFIRTDVILYRFGLRILLVPFIAGFSFEIIRFAGKSSSPIVNLISYPGLMLQRISTNEPDDGQIECAIAALKAVLESDKK